MLKLLIWRELNTCRRLVPGSRGKVAQEFIDQTRLISVCLIKLIDLPAIPSLPVTTRWAAENDIAFEKEISHDPSRVFGVIWLSSFSFNP